MKASLSTFELEQATHQGVAGMAAYHVAGNSIRASKMASIEHRVRTPCPSRLAAEARNTFFYINIVRNREIDERNRGHWYTYGRYGAGPRTKN